MLAAYRWTVRGIVSLGCCAAIVAILHAYPLLPWPLAAAVAVNWNMPCNSREPCDAPSSATTRASWTSAR